MAEKIVMASEVFGLSLKDAIKEHLISKGFDVVDYGTDSPKNFVTYFDTAAKVARAIQNGVAKRGMVFCGSGMGVSISANKFKGIYCGLVESEFTAEGCKIVNNCNVLAMGAKVISEFRAKIAVDLWLAKEFGEGNTPEVKQLLKDGLGEIASFENEHMK